MNCPRTLKRLPLYAGGDLDLRDRAEVDAHLQSCLSCYRELAAYREMLGRVRGASARRQPLSSQPFGADFSASVMAQIDGPPPVARWRPRLVMLSGWAAAAALALMFVWGSGPGPVAGGDVPESRPGPLVHASPNLRAAPASLTTSGAEGDREIGAEPGPLGPWMPLRPIEGEGDARAMESFQLNRRDLRSIPVSLPARQIRDF